MSNTPNMMPDGLSAAVDRFGQVLTRRIGIDGIPLPDSRGYNQLKQVMALGAVVFGDDVPKKISFIESATAAIGGTDGLTRAAGTIVSDWPEVGAVIKDMTQGVPIANIISPPLT